MEVKLGYKRSEVGVIPDNWSVEAIETAFDVCNHLRLPLSRAIREKIAGQYPYYGPTGVQGWINEYRVEGEYALIGEDGDHFLKWRSQPMTLLVRGRFNVNNHAHLVRGTKNLTEWFYWVFANRDLTPFLTRQGAGRYKLTKAALLKIPCALPSPCEQRAIVDALTDAEKLLFGLDRLIAKKRDLKQAAMQLLLTGTARLSRFHHEWKPKKISELLRYQRPDKFIVRSTDYEDSGDVPVLTANKSFILGYTTEDFGVYDDLPVIIFDDFTTDHKYVDFPFKIKSSAIKILKAQNEDVNLKFVSERMRLLKFPLGEHKRYYISEYQNMELPTPEPDEQIAIAKVLTDMDAEIARLEQRREKTLALKQGMMHALLTGKTRLV